MDINHSFELFLFFFILIYIYKRNAYNLSLKSYKGVYCLIHFGGRSVKQFLTRATRVARVHEDRHRVWTTGGRCTEARPCILLGIKPITSHASPSKSSVLCIVG